MDQDTYIHSITHLPSVVIIDLKPQVRRLQLLFRDKYEFVMHCIIEDVMDRAQYRYNINLRTKQILQRVLEIDKEGHPDAGHDYTWNTRKVQYFDRLVDFEQTALAVQHEIENHRLYS